MILLRRITLNFGILLPFDPFPYICLIFSILSPQIRELFLESAPFPEEVFLPLLQQLVPVVKPYLGQLHELLRILDGLEGDEDAAAELPVLVRIGAEDALLDGLGPGESAKEVVELLRRRLHLVEPVHPNRPLQDDGIELVVEDRPLRVEVRFPHGEQALVLVHQPVSALIELLSGVAGLQGHEAGPDERRGTVWLK